MAYALTSHVSANNIIKLTDSNILKESQARLKQQSFTIDINSANQINQQLNQVENKIDKIVATDKVLKQLQQISPTEDQQNWVKQQTQTTDILYIENIDHPNQKIELVNISKQANTTIHLWQVNQIAVEIKQAWRRGEWVNKDNLPR